ncbi:MAG: hypothetical protein FJ221_11950 [Lentisphaerae bacterium]|nr:hypothetical protein [Lentisphaerota bacterium]
MKTASRAGRTPRRPRPRTAITLAALAAFASGLQAAGAAGGPGEAFTLDLTRYRTVDPKLRTWVEHAPIRVKPAGLTAIAAGTGDTFVASAGRTLMRIDLGGKPVRSADLPEPVRCMAIAPNGDVAIGFVRGFVVCNPDFEIKAEGPELGEKAMLTSLAACSNGIHAADAGQRIVWTFDPTGRMLGRNEGPPEGGFVVPSPHFDVWADADGTLWVANPGELRIESYGPDGKPGTRWGRPGFAIEGFCGCCNPTDFARMADGSFVTAEKGLARVKVYRSDGSLESVVAGPDEFDEDTVGLDVAVDSRGRVLVVDPKRQAIRVFVRKPAGEKKP